MTLGTVSVELGILGDLTATRAGRPVTIPRGMSQSLLLALVVERDRPIGDHDLVDRLWGSSPPPNALASLRNTVSRLRSLLGADLIERPTAGYRLSRATCRLDVDAFDELVAEARRLRAGDDAEGALLALDTALALVRGPVLAHAAGEWWAMAAAHEVTERIALAEELWAEIRLRYDRAGRELGRMHQAARAQPQRELRWRQVMEGLATAGRRTEALRVADEAKRALSEFGLTPGPQIIALETALLGSLDDVDAVAGVRADDHLGRLAAMRHNPFVGREPLLAELATADGAVWLDGEPGIGKTRLLAEVAAAAVEQGALVLYGACERSAAAGTQLIVDIATAALNACPRRPHVPVELAALLGHDDAGEGNAHLDPAIRRARIRSGVLALLTTVASEQPVLVLADDVHWIDDDAADFVLHLLERTPSSVRWMFASRHRSERAASVHLRSELIRRETMHAYWLEPLAKDDLRQLVQMLAPDSDATTRAAIVDEVTDSSSGNALLATELIAHRLARPDDHTTPPRLDAIVGSMLDVLADDELQLLTTLAVAGPRCPPRLLADALGVGIDQMLAIAERVVVTGLLSPPTATVVDFRHEVLAGVVRNRLDLATERSARERLIDAAASDQRHAVALADHLLALGELLTEQRAEQRHHAVAVAVKQLAQHNDNEQAAWIGRRYLQLAAADTTPAAIEAKLRVATALIAGGHVAEGSMLLDALTGHARATGDAILRTDLVLARGPLQTGGMHANAVANEAEELLHQLPTTEVGRWVQLACWAAHHRLNEGDRDRALELLRDVDQLRFPPDAPYLRGLVLAIRTQADVVAVRSPGPAEAQASLAALGEYARLTDDETTVAAEALFGLGAAFMFGSADDVAIACAAIEQSSVRLPRSDLRWWPLVADAAAALATGELVAASEAIDRAMQHGGDTGVEMAVRTGLMQRAQHMLLSGQLGSIVGMLEPQATIAGAPTTIVSIYGLACVEAGDLARARRVADMLRARLPVLVGAGIAWPNAAMAAAEIAAFVGDAELAASLWDELHRWSGSGLSVMGAAYFGAVDASLGRLALTMGRKDEGLALLAQAQQYERERGWTAWEQRVARAIEHATAS